MNDKLILQSMGLKLIDNRKKIRPYVIIEITGDLHDGDEVVEKTEFSLDDENLKKIMDILNKNHYYELFLTRHFFVMGWNEQKDVYKRLNGLNNKKIDEETLRKAIAQANVGRQHILSKMLEVIDKPNERLSKYAPEIISFKISDFMHLRIDPECTFFIDHFVLLIY